ncbi:MAG TPA: hypothetical protein VL242_50100 [Sorangium sp.]|nr:hypothetical protein [Sorangium sp.]
MAAITEPAAGAQEASEGVSLAQYAAVRAAVSEGFPLADVLAVEGLRPRAFARADLHWKQRLAAEPELLAAFEEELARAEDWLDRPIEPLADDAAAWASFLAAFGAHPAPFELLREKRVGMNDMARLRRRWARRAEEDTKLGELLAELRARPGELGPLRVGPQVLRPSRGAGARGPADAPTSEATAAAIPSEPGLGLAEYAALCAGLEALPHQRERVLRRHGLADEEACAALDRRWRAALARDAALAKDFERLEAHHARRLEMLLARARDVGDVERSTAPAIAEQAPPTAPSREVTAGAPGAVKPPAPATAHTGPLLDILRGPALPFETGASGLAAPSAPTAWPRPPRAPRDVAEALPEQAPPRGSPEIPFAAAEPARPVGAPASSRRAAQAPAELGETSLSVKVPRELLGQAYAQAAVTGTAPQGSIAASSSKAGGGSQAPLAEPSEISLPLAQYAALCAELVLFPDASEAIFQRYGLGSTEMRSAVDAAWKERLSERPAEYARWQELYRRHHAHFRNRGAPAE